MEITRAIFAEGTGVRLDNTFCSFVPRDKDDMLF